MCYLLAITLLTFSSEGNAMLIRHDRTIDEYRELAAQPQFLCVGRVYRDDRKDWASGVLVSPQWVLTAAHVVDKRSPENYQWEFNGKRFDAVEHVFHPSRLAKRPRSARFQHFDLALVKLEHAVTEVVPATLYEGRDEIGLIATMVGNGRQGDGVNGTRRPGVQERLAGRNRIDAHDGHFYGMTVSSGYLLCEFDAPDGSSNRLGSDVSLELEACPALGDSGGGLFIRVDNRWMLAGTLCGPVLSVEGKIIRGISDRYGAIIASARTSSVTDWIKGTIGKKLK
jgi:hypothetical protein